MVSEACRSFALPVPRSSRTSDWLLGHYEPFTPFLHIFPKLKPYRPEWLNDVKQTLFTHCNEVLFFSHWRKKILYVLFSLPFNSLKTPMPWR